MSDIKKIKDEYLNKLDKDQNIESINQIWKKNVKFPKYVQFLVTFGLLTVFIIIVYLMSKSFF